MTLQLNQDKIREMIGDGERIDEREFMEYRDVDIEADYISTTADGSAYVQIGDTKLVVGISMDTDSPYPDRPGQGTIITNAELTPMAAPEFESGPPGEEATEIARVVDRGIRESGMIDLEDLIIEEGETCWMAFIDIHVIDYDGNLLDAAAIGATTALLDADLPALNDDGTVDRENHQGELPTNGAPMTITGSKIAGQVLFDTTAEEEDVLDARLTVTFKEDGNVVNMQKGGQEPLRKAETEEILEIAEEKGEMLRERIYDALEEAE